MSAITEEITSLQKELHECLDTDSPINPRQLKRLEALFLERLKELVSTHEKRLEIMKTKTREMTSKLPPLSDSEMKLNSASIEKLFEEQEKYDASAIRWVNDPELSLWEDSDLPGITTGILILYAKIGGVIQ